MTSYSFALTQKVNFFISAAFIFLVGSVFTGVIVNVINRDSTDFQYLANGQKQVQAQLDR